MNCQDLKLATKAYFADELEPQARAAFDAHLASCESCAGFLKVAGEMTCQHLADFLSDYLEGNLPTGQADIFERHMNMCPPCLDYMEALRATIAAGRKACEAEDHQPVPEALVQAILKAKRSG